MKPLSKWNDHKDPGLNGSGRMKKMMMSKKNHGGGYGDRCANAREAVNKRRNKGKNPENMSNIRFLHILYRKSPTKSSGRFVYMKFFPFKEYFNKRATKKQKFIKLLSIYVYGGSGNDLRLVSRKRNAELNKLAESIPQGKWATEQVFEDDEGGKIWLVGYIERMIVQLPSLSLPMSNKQ